MLQNLRLQRFKNFRDAHLALGNLTLLVGANASGKSNLRDAFRFLHGISRGYTVAEIIGEKWIEGGSQVWKGIRGGTREATYEGGTTFSLEATLSPPASGTYRIDIDVGTNGKPPRVVRESAWVGPMMYFDSHPVDAPPPQEDPQHLLVQVPPVGGEGQGKSLRFLSNQPVLSQAAGRDSGAARMKAWALRTMDVLGSMRFLDLAPDAMRIPSLPGQDILGDRGENLSSVLQVICESPHSKAAILEWLQTLTPLDVVDFEFPSDLTGKVLLVLVESGGRRTSAYSASDGTLRFLAVIAALLGPNPAKLYFVEELENGIHPTRLHLLLQLIEHKVSDGAIQVVATTHSPQLLGFLSEKARADAALVYRLENHPDARIRRIMEIPEADRVLREQELARLLASGWLEDAVAFSEGSAT